MPIILKFIISIIFFFFAILGLGNAEEVKKIGKFKDWETVVYSNGTDKVCFAQSKPVL